MVNSEVWRLAPFLRGVCAVAASHSVQRVYRVPGCVERVERLEGQGQDIVLSEYDQRRFRAYQHPTATRWYRDLIDSLNALDRALPKKPEEARQVFGTSNGKSSERQATLTHLILKIERLIGELVAGHRGFLEDPVVLAYWRISMVMQNDRFFQRLGQAIKKRTRRHAASKPIIAAWVAAWREGGWPLDVLCGYLKIETTPDAQRKLLKRHGIEIDRAEEQAAKRDPELQMKRRKLAEEWVENRQAHAEEDRRKPVGAHRRSDTK